MANHPGSTEEQLPDDVLALLTDVSYLSTACETGHLLRIAVLENSKRADLPKWEKKMHERCRLNHKFLGSPCFCYCHTLEREKNDEGPNQQKAGLGTDRTQA